VLIKCLQCIEADFVPRATVCCEPQLGKRGLYPTLSAKGSTEAACPMMDLLAYADGRRSLLTIAERIGRPMWELVPIAGRLCAEGLMIDVD